MEIGILAITTECIAQSGRIAGSLPD
jgi:hypothetical protein